MRVTLWTTTAIHLDTPKSRLDPFVDPFVICRRAQEDLWFSGSGQAAHGVRHLWEQVPVDRCRGLRPSIRVNRVRAYARRVR